MPAESDRLFLDTGYVMARFNRRDQHHAAAIRLAPLVADGRQLWTTEAVLFEIAAAFSHPDFRNVAVRLWDQFHNGDSRFQCVEATGNALTRAMGLFRDRHDKSWSLTDCLSFIVMQDQSLTDALTPDHHFVQAGFRALMLEEES